MLRRSIFLLVAFCLTLSTLFTILCRHSISTSVLERIQPASSPEISPLSSSRLLNDDDDCLGFDPHQDERHDPPRCFRAVQFRQLQAFRKDPKYLFDWEVYAALDQLEKCALGWKVCPERPLIVSDWWYLQQGMQSGTSGEEIWLGGVTDAVKDEGFEVVAVPSKLKVRYLLRALSEFVHMYWAQDIWAFECITNPMCIRPEDYHPATNAEYRFDMEIPDEEMGRLPLWRIFATTYWGARPVESFHSADDRHLGPIGQDWSYNPLGNQFTISPYAYPGHSWIPTSMERDALAFPPVPQAERNDSVLILAKHSSLFHAPPWSTHMKPQWPALVSLLHSRNHEFWALADEDDNMDNVVPEGIVNLGRQDRLEYQEVLSKAKVLMGIGRPEISPSPYVALARGVPVLLPYTGETPTLSGWGLYDSDLSQHGPANLLGEPWVYTYDVNDPSDLERKLLRAIQTPIPVFIPPDYSEQNLRIRTGAILYRDYEVEFEQSKDANGGEVVRYPDEMLQRCWWAGVCERGRNGELPD